MSATCEPLLDALKDCLMRSDCVLKRGKLPSECLREHTDELPDSCKSLRQAVFECKRGLVSPFQSPSCHRFVDHGAGGYEETIQGKPSGHDGERHMESCVYRRLLGDAYRARSCRRKERAGTSVGFDRVTHLARPCADNAAGRTRVPYAWLDHHHRL